MKDMWISVKITLAMCLLLGVGYVAVLCLTAVLVPQTQRAMAPLRLHARTVGVAGVGQSFTDSRFFWGRPSAVNYAAEHSGGSNQAASNPAYLKQLERRIQAFLGAHSYLSRSEVPAEMVTASASGLDPDLSPRAAAVQVRRVATVRGLDVQRVESLVDSLTEAPWLGLFGTAKVNVLKLNVALERIQPLVSGAVPQK